jgi:hypothetical protein
MARDRNDAINSYISDMLALEDEMEKAFAGQVSDYEQESPEVVAQLRRIHDVCELHIRNLRDLSERRTQGGGRGLADAVKRAGSVIAGLTAAAINVVRTEKLPKSLRDDFTALNLAAIGYTMLYTTARSLEEPTVAEVAQRHLRDYAEAVMVLHNLIPAAVVGFLREDGLPASPEVLPDVHRTLEEIWRSVGTTQETHTGFNR